MQLDLELGSVAEGLARYRPMSGRMERVSLPRNIILINGAIFAACLSFFAVWEADLPARVYAGFSAFMVAFLPAVMVTREDKFEAMILGCSLPVERKTIVRARFVLSVGMALAGILGAFLLGSFLPFSSFRAGA